jgi:hypothetical protein
MHQTDITAVVCRVVESIACSEYVATSLSRLYGVIAGLKPRAFIFVGALTEDARETLRILVGSFSVIRQQKFGTFHYGQRNNLELHVALIINQCRRLFSTKFERNFCGFKDIIWPLPYVLTFIGKRFSH